MNTYFDNKTVACPAPTPYDKAVTALYEHRVLHPIPAEDSPEWAEQATLAAAARTLQQVARDAELQANHDRVAAIARAKSKARWA